MLGALFKIASSSKLTTSIRMLNMKQNKIQSIFLLMSILLLLNLGYFSILDLWWMFDDAQHLKLVAITNLDVFTKKASEVGYIPANFTPWLFFNYWIDLKLFGLSPSGAFHHQLLSLSFTAVSVFLLLSRITTPIIAALTIIYFFFTPVAHTVIHILCTRHYLEGLGYLSLGFLFFLKYRESGLLRFLFLSCVLSLIAFLNKEIYVSALGVVLCVSFFDYIEKRKVSCLAPVLAYISITGFYIVYRIYALGWDNLLQGYGSAIDHDGMIEIYRYLVEIIKFNELLPVFVFMLFSAVYYLAYLIKVRGLYSAFKFSSYIITVLICVLVPIYKVMPTANVNHNYIFLSTYTFIAISSFLIYKICEINKSSFVKVFFLVSFCAITYYQHHHTLPKATLNIQNKSMDIFKRFKVEGEYLLYSKDSTSHYILNPIGAPWHHSGLIDLRKIYLKNVDGPQVCYNTCECTEKDSVYVYQNGALLVAQHNQLECKSE